MATEFQAPSLPQGPRHHDIGPGGVVVVAVEADDVRLRGIDGTEARVASPADGAGIETLAEPGRFTVRTARNIGLEKTGFVGIKVGSRGFGMPLRLRVSGTVEVDVPRDARVVVTSSAGDVSLRDVRGGVSVKTASGDISIKRGGGSVVAETASGDVQVAGGEPLSLEVRAVSGDVRARAPQFDRVAIQTVSGDAELAGRFGPAEQHAVSTVSGDVELALVGGLTLQVRTVSGSVECDHPDRRDGDGRKRPLVIGDGRAQLAVRTMSGDVEVRAGKPAPAGAEIDLTVGAARGAPFGFPAAPPLPPLPPQPPIAPAVAPPTPSAPATASATEVTTVAAAPVAHAASPAEPAGAPDPVTLAVLEALARGEIDVAEAERRLAAAPEPVAPVSDAVPGAEPQQDSSAERGVEPGQDSSAERGAEQEPHDG